MKKEIEEIIMDFLPIHKMEIVRNRLMQADLDSETIKNQLISMAEKDKLIQYLENRIEGYEAAAGGVL